MRTGEGGKRGVVRGVGWWKAATQRGGKEGGGWASGTRGSVVPPAEAGNGRCGTRWIWG
jgi:hypothetical protein